MPLEPSKQDLLRAALCSHEQALVDTLQEGDEALSSVIGVPTLLVPPGHPTPAEARHAQRRLDFFFGGLFDDAGDIERVKAFDFSDFHAKPLAGSFSVTVNKQVNLPVHLSIGRNAGGGSVLFVVFSSSHTKRLWHQGAEGCRFWKPTRTQTVSLLERIQQCDSFEWPGWAVVFATMVQRGLMQRPFGDDYMASGKYTMSQRSFDSAYVVETAVQQDVFHGVFVACALMETSEYGCSDVYDTPLCARLATLFKRCCSHSVCKMLHTFVEKSAAGEVDIETLRMAFGTATRQTPPCRIMGEVALPHRMITIAAQTFADTMDDREADEAAARLERLLLDEEARLLKRVEKKKQKKHARKVRKRPPAGLGSEASTPPVPEPEPTQDELGNETSPTPPVPEPEPTQDELDELSCPITCSLMHDPVMAHDGVTYERKAISLWFEAHRTSPVTGAKLDSIALLPNNFARAIIARFVERNPAHPEATRRV